MILNWMGVSRTARFTCLLAAAAGVLALPVDRASAQRTFGVDVSYWQSEITQNAWNYAYNTDNRRFAFVRASRGGTTGLGQTSGTPGNPTQETLSRRYDDSRFIQNMVRATNAGLITGPYHFARPDILTNTGADEADHFMQMAGPYMRPGYMLPMYDLEAGQAQLTQQELAQFSLDFSNRIYEVMKIRPSIYANGNYMNDLAGANTATRNALAQPSPNGPSMVSPAYPVLFAARYPAGSGQPYNEAVHGSLQTQNPKDAGSTLSWFFGPFDDYGNSQPWHFWQYSSGEAPFGPNGDVTTDGDVSQGDIEFVRDTLVPAVWWNDASGDWSTLTNWNSGQPVVAPQVGAGQAAQFTTGPLPVARLPGSAGTGPTSGQYDTVILERPNANITVTISNGSHNVRKLYMREALNITGGTLTVNYDPLYNFNVGNPGALRSGPISAQFSGAVTLSDTGALSVPVLQIDASKTFTLAGGTLTFNTINLQSNAKVLVSGNISINPYNTSNPRYTSRTAVISGDSGNVDLGGGVRTITVGNLSDDVDLDVAVPIVNGGLTKEGAGTMRVSGNNTFAGAVTINGGVLRYNHSSGLTSATVVTVNNGSTLDMNNISDAIASLASATGHTTGAVLQGTASLSLAAGSGTTTFDGTITGTGAFTKSGAGTQILNGNNNLGPVAVNAGTLLFNGANTTGNVTVNGGTLGGIGSVSGAVTIQSGAHLAPGASIESLSVGALTLNTGSILDFEVGPPGVGDMVNVNALLNINGGSLNIVNTGGLALGSYPLFTYGSLGGSLSNLNLINVPSDLNYSLVNSGGQISLSVSAIPEPTAAALLALSLACLASHSRCRRGHRTH